MATFGTLPLILLSHRVPPVLEFRARFAHILYETFIQLGIVSRQYFRQLIESVASFKERLYLIALLLRYFSYRFFIVLLFYSQWE